MRRASWYAAALLAIAARVDAQTTSDSTREASVIVVGDRVDLRSTPVDRRGARAECEGDVTAIAGDTIVVGNTNAPRTCPRWTYGRDVVAELRVARGHRGSRAKHALVGFAIGAAVGGTLGYLSVGTDDCTGECDLDGLLTAAAALGVGTLGGLTGTIIGALLPAGPNWLTVPVPGPIRVAGVRVQPALRVGLGHARR
jgi:hypothetical protein